MYDIRDGDIDNAGDQPQLSAVAQSAPLQMQLPVVELLKVCFCVCVCVCNSSMSLKIQASFGCETRSWVIMILLIDFMHGAIDLMVYVPHAEYYLI